MLKDLISFSLEKIFGRKNFVRLARFLNNQARLDLPNDFTKNGEILLQSVVCKNEAIKVSHIIDIGAHTGLWTISFLEQMIKSNRTNFRIHAFEPCASSFKVLHANVSKHKLSNLVSFVNKGVSAISGIGMLNIVGNSFGINSLHQHPLEQYIDIEKVNLITVDQYCQSNQLDYISMIKLDIEGHEMAALEGAKGMISNNMVPVVQFEYNHRWIASRHYLKDAFDYFIPYGYKLGKVTPRGIESYKHWHPELESFTEANYIAYLPAFESKITAFAWWMD
jgi:FkbM family methyltransferase